MVVWCPQLKVCYIMQCKYNLMCRVARRLIVSVLYCQVDSWTNEASQTESQVRNDNLESCTGKAVSALILHAHPAGLAGAIGLPLALSSVVAAAAFAASAAATAAATTDGKALCIELLLPARSVPDV